VLDFLVFDFVVDAGRPIDVIDRVDDLAHLLVVRVLLVELVLEILFEQRVLGLEILDLLLKLLHFPGLVVKHAGHLLELLLLGATDFLHLRVDIPLAHLEFLVFIFEVDEASAQGINAIALLIAVFYAELVVFNDLL
jgi:hypothetical protein